MTQSSPAGMYPAGYLKQMKNLLGKDYPVYLDSLCRLPVKGLRLNTLKLSPEAFSSLWEEASPLARSFGLDSGPGQELAPSPLPWLSEGFEVDEAVYGALAKHPYYYAGAYYLQEPSAQTPASRLPLMPGDYVLDLCAAPGGKSTQLLMRLKGQGLLVANDVSASRAQALKRNLQLAGAVNAFVTAEEPVRLAGRYPAFFDAILVDAPCSGEGMFRREPAMLRYYESRGPAAYAPLQTEILDSALRMLRPGGRLMFSTCTFSPLENENNVLRLLDRHPDLHLIPIAPAYHGFAPGVLGGAEECVRIYPHRMAGEGQFMALFKKEGETRPRKPAKAAYLETGGSLYRLPEGLTPERGIRYLLTGLEVAAVKGKKLLPAQPLAMALGSRDWDRILDLSLTDVRVEKYLKGETIEAEEAELISGDAVPSAPPPDRDLESTAAPPALPCRQVLPPARNLDRTPSGLLPAAYRRDFLADLPSALDRRDILVTVHGLPLGFGALSRGLVKNKRPAGWRMT